MRTYKSYYFIVFLCVICFVSCRNINIEENRIKNVVVKYYDIDRNVKKTDSIQLYRVIIQNLEYNILFKDTDIYAFPFIKPIFDDSIIIFDNIKCFFLSKYKYNIDNKNIVVYRYYYDKKNCVDEEFSFFYVKEYGLILTYIDSWGKIGYSISTNNVTNMIIDSVINDNKNFLRLKSPPLPSNK
jgi:hypothetical protein